MLAEPHKSTLEKIADHSEYLQQTESVQEHQESLKISTQTVETQATRITHIF